MAQVRLHFRWLAATFLAAAFVFAGVATPSAQAYSHAEATAANVILQATNDHRASHSRSPLTRVGEIDVVAQAWAEQMLADRHLRHNPNWWDQLPSEGKRSGAENVAYACGYGDATRTANILMDGWKGSEGHNRNMLNGDFTHIGIGFAWDSASRCGYAVQNFGQYTRDFVNVQEFSDVSPAHQFYSQISWLSNSGITTGYSDGSFRPREEVSREAFAAFLYRDAGRPSVNMPANSPFTDVPKSAQFYKEIVWLEQQNITTGWADGTFRPRESIERNAMAAFLYRYSGQPTYTPPSTSPFGDISTSSKFYKEITWLNTQNITTGWADGTYRPFGNVTREATAAFFHRMNGRP